MKRVTRYLTLLIICIGVFSPAWAGMNQARILIGTSEAALAPAPVFDGSAVLAPLHILSLLGTTYTDSTGDSVIVTSAAGESGAIKTVDVNGARMIPMDKVITLIGGERIWNASTRTLTLIARLNSVEFDNDTLKINCSFPTHASVKTWGGKIIVDVANTKLASEAKEIYIGSPTVSRARLGQVNSTTSRIVLETSKQMGCVLDTTETTAQITLKVSDNLPIPEIQQPAPQQQPTAKPFIVNNISIQTADEKSYAITIATSGKGAVSGEMGISPPRIQINLSKARIGDSCAMNGACSAVTPVLKKTASGLQLTLKLTRPMVYGVETRDSAIMVYVRPPDKSGGKLAGKLIVIDPGHGGKETGAQGGGYFEKNITLQIAKELEAALTKQGAKTLLTRSGDDVVSLAARPEVAISTGADFFVSVHCNSNLAPGSATGIETYYHMQEPSPKLLACAIHDGVCKFTGMCDRRARSDRSLYQPGLKVLRDLSGSGIPGVLVECGYINNNSDRAKLLDAKYRAKLAEGIVAGLKAYIQGTPIQ